MWQPRQPRLWNDAFDSTKIDIIVSNYIDGHNAKWGLQFSTFDSDDPALEVDVIYLQLNLIF